MNNVVKLMLILLMVLGVSPKSLEGAELPKVRVGVFQVEPLNFTNANGVAEGFNTDLIREIAKVQGRWEPDFVPVTWAEGLDGLQKETIDLMMAVTYTPERAKVLDYSKESVIDVWGQVFVRPDSGIESAIDLEGLRVGIMKSDVHGLNFIKLTEAFGIECDLVEEDTHEALFQSVAEGKLEAAVVPSHYGLRKAQEYHLVGTAVQFSPAPIYFAAKKGLQSDVLLDADSLIASWKQDDTSFYYKRFNYWFGREFNWMQSVPLWLKIVVGWFVVLSVVFLVLSWLFKRQVLLSTRELAESRERYRMIVENQIDLIVKVDTEGHFLYVSPSYCNVFGKTEAELLNKRFLPLVHEEDRESTEIEFAKIFDPPHEAYMEQRALTRHGWRWFSWQNSAILDDEGEIKEIIGIGRDITERKEAQISNAKTSERLRLATHAAQVGIWEYDFVANKLIWDDQMFILFDVDQDTFEGTLESWERTVHPDDLEPTKAKLQKAIENTLPFETDFRVVDRANHIRHIRALAEVEQDMDGENCRLIGMNWDVSTHKQMVTALTASEQDYRQLFENMTTGFLQFEVQEGTRANPEDFRIVQINEAGCTMLLKSRSQLVGYTLKQLFDPLEDYWIDVLAKVAVTGKPSAYENRLEVLGLVLSTWIFVPKPGFLAVVVTDNTARRTAEDAVLRAQQQLQHIVDSTNDVIFQMEVDGTLTYMNSAIERVAGYTIDEMLGKNILDVILPQYHEMIRERIHRRVSGNPERGHFSFEIRCKNGSVKWIENATSGIYDASGLLERIQGTARDVTIRKEAERALEESRRFLRVILDMIPVGVFWKDVDLNYLGANRTFLDAHGFRDVDEIFGKNDLSINRNEEVAEGYMNVDRAVIASGEAQLNFEERQVHVSESERTLLTSKMPLRNAENQIVGVLGAYVDVTAWKAAEQELEDSRVFLRSIIDTIPSRVFWKDCDSRYLGCNLAFAKDSGFDRPEDVVGKTDYEFGWSEVEADLYRDDDRNVMESGLERINYEEPQTRAGGAKFWLSTSKVPMRDQSGAVIGVLGAYQDISERKVLEDERIKLSAAINQSAEAIVIMDLKGDMKYVNPAFEDVTGFCPDEAIGANLSILRSNRHDEPFYAEIWTTLEKGVSWNGRIINQHKNGSFFTSETAISPVKDVRDQVVSYVVAIRDVSEQVELEEHIRQAQKMDAVGRLAGGVAHDFNNILQSILGFSGILLSELDQNSSQYDDVSEIRKAARRAGDLTRQLLTLSRKNNVEYTILNLNAIIRNNTKMMRRLIGEHIEFVFELGEDLFPVRADSSQIEQIILNLFINARDAMPDGGRVFVKTYNADIDLEAQDSSSPTARGFICLEVSDTGCGIRDDIRAHLFEPFFTTKQIGEGTGLGLSVVYGIVQQHGGHIEVNSRVGEGAVFQVYLPVCDLNEVDVPGDDGASEYTISLEGHGETVLVVEDDPILRELSNRMLSDAGYVVTAIANVNEAEAALKGTPFELLLVDVVLPDGNGLDFVQRARAAGGDFAALLCSGYSQGADVHQAMQTNGFRYLEKPIGSMQLLQTVREMLDERRSV
jgi:PAS domain S-box-containing protein